MRSFHVDDEDPLMRIRVLSWGAVCWQGDLLLLGLVLRLWLISAKACRLILSALDNGS